MKRLKPSTEASDTVGSHTQEPPAYDASVCDASSSADVDKGFKAWRFLFVAFMIEGLVWGESDVSHYLVDVVVDKPCLAYHIPSQGPPLSFGVFLDYPPYSEMNRSLAALIGLSLQPAYEERFMMNQKTNFKNIL